MRPWVCGFDFTEVSMKNFLSTMLLCPCAQQQPPTTSRPPSEGFQPSDLHHRVSPSQPGPRGPDTSVISLNQTLNSHVLTFWLLFKTFASVKCLGKRWQTVIVISPASTEHQPPAETGTVTDARVYFRTHGASLCACAPHRIAIWRTRVVEQSNLADNKSLKRAGKRWRVKLESVRQTAGEFGLNQTQEKKLEVCVFYFSPRSRRDNQ